jgi:hypothetical protein
MTKIDFLEKEISWLKQNLILFSRVKRKTVLEYLNTRLTILKEEEAKLEDARKLVETVKSISPRRDKRKKHNDEKEI